MTLEYIFDILDANGKDPIFLQDCILTLEEPRCRLYLLQDNHIEVVDAGNHKRVFYKGLVKDSDELKYIILKNL